MGRYLDISNYTTVYDPVDVALSISACPKLESIYWNKNYGFKQLPHLYLPALTDLHSSHSADLNRFCFHAPKLDLGKNLMLDGDKDDLSGVKWSQRKIEGGSESINTFRPYKKFIDFWGVFCTECTPLVVERTRKVGMNSPASLGSPHNFI